MAPTTATPKPRNAFVLSATRPMAAPLLVAEGAPDPLDEPEVGVLEPDAPLDTLEPLGALVGAGEPVGAEPLGAVALPLGTEVTVPPAEEEPRTGGSKFICQFMMDRLMRRTWDEGENGVSYVLAAHS